MIALTERGAAHWLRERDNFLFLTHVRPDGDTLGSAEALCLALRKLGKTAWLQHNPEVAERERAFLSLPWAPEGYVPEHVVSVDVSDENRICRGAEQYQGRVELCIDHHGSNTRTSRYLCLNADAAAVGEMVFRILTILGVMDGEIARALYIAVSTDCGCFAYSNTSPETHRIAAALMAQGDFAKAINKRFFQTNSRMELLLQSRLMASMEFLLDGQAALASITLADKAELGALDSDCDGLASFASTIEGVRCAVFLRELDDGVVKASVRCDPDWINASDLCAHFGGGGHAAAAGCSFPQGVTIAEARETMRAALLAEKG